MAQHNHKINATKYNKYKMNRNKFIHDENATMEIIQLYFNLLGQVFFLVQYSVLKVKLVEFEHK